jgi:hypothetical protein
MSERIKTPNLDEIFEKWKQKAARQIEKKWKILSVNSNLR